MTRGWAPRSLAAAVLLVALVATGPPAAANGNAALVVTTLIDSIDATDGALSLREAVIAANSAPGHDTIVLAAGATYTLTICSGDHDEDAALTGDLDLTDAAGLTLQSPGAATIVQSCPAAQRQRILHNLGGGTLGLSGIHLQGGAGDDGGAVLSNGPLSISGGSVTGARSRPAATGNLPEQRAAAAIFVSSGTLQITGTSVEGNDAVGITNASTQPTTLLDVTVTANGYSSSTAGGIALFGGGSVTASRVTANSSLSFLGGGLTALSCEACPTPRTTVTDSILEGNAGLVGGGIHGDVDLVESTLRDNFAVIGGGAAVRGSIARSTIEGNLAFQSAGGLYVRGPVEGSTIAGNEAISWAGGIAFEGASSLIRSTVTLNKAPAVGGIQAMGEGDGQPKADVQMVFSTVAGNDADDEGVGFADELSTVPRAGETIPGAITLRNSVVGEPGGVADCEPGSNVVSVGGNFQPGSSCSFGSSDISNGGSPQLGPLLDNGGPTRTRLPEDTSPVIDRIALGDPSCGGVDQRGLPRPAGAGCDIGAVEVGVATSGFVAVTPFRVLDTRSGPVPPGRPLNTKLNGGSVLKVPIRGTGSVPTDATAVVLNITSTEATTSSAFVTAWPSGVAMPLASTLNLQPGANVANSSTLPIGPDGAVSFFTNAGATHLIADVLGYYTTASPQGFTGTTPVRALDTRFGPVPPGRVVGASLSGPGTLRLPLAGSFGIPADATAVAVNVTATQSSTDLAYATIWPAGEPRPLASNLNLQPGFNVANLAVVKVGAGGAVDLFTNNGSTHLVADVVGFYREGSGGRLVPVSPTRLLDTRSGAKVAAGGTVDLQVGGTANVPGDALAAVLNVTSTEAASPTGFLTVHPQGSLRPTASTLNYRPPFNVPNQALARLSANGGLSLYSGAAASHVVVDASGYFVEA